jgi:hypothetical protein
VGFHGTRRSIGSPCVVALFSSFLHSDTSKSGAERHGNSASSKAFPSRGDYSRLTPINRRVPGPLVGNRKGGPLEMGLLVCCYGAGIPARLVDARLEKITSACKALPALHSAAAAIRHCHLLISIKSRCCACVLDRFYTRQPAVILFPEASGATYPVPAEDSSMSMLA